MDCSLHICCSKGSCCSNALLLSAIKDGSQHLPLKGTEFGYEFPGLEKSLNIFLATQKDGLQRLGEAVPYTFTEEDLAIFRPVIPLLSALAHLGTLR